MTTTPHATELRTWTGPAALPHLDELMAIYRAAFLDLWEADPEQATRERRANVRSHLQRPETTVSAALDSDGNLVGFAYGAPGRRGGWWHDTVSERLSASERMRWLSDCFEVVELHVHPSVQGHGIGRSLLRHLLVMAPSATTALSALDDPELPARRLYDSVGFLLLRRNFHFPGTDVAYSILVADLPLR